MFTTREQEGGDCSSREQGSLLHTRGQEGSLLHTREQEEVIHPMRAGRLYTHESREEDY